MEASLDRHLGNARVKAQKIVCALFVVAGLSQLELGTALGGSTAAIDRSTSPPDGSRMAFRYLDSRLWGWMYDVHVEGDYAYCGLINGLMVFDISEPSAPRCVSKVFLPGGCAIEVVVENSHAYVADGDGGLNIINVENPASPRNIGTWTSRAPVICVDVRDNVALVGMRDSGLVVLDVADPTSPRVLAEPVRRETVSAVTMEGQYGYLGSNASGLVVLDISKPEAPIRKGSSDWFVQPDEIVVDSAIAFVIQDNQHSREDFQVCDVRDPDNPKLISTFDVPGRAVGLCKNDGLAYIASMRAFDDDVLYTIDIRDSSSPRVMAKTTLPITMYGLDIAAGHAYVPGPDAFLIVRIRSGLKMTQISARVHLSTWLFDIQVYGDLAYVAGDDIYILDLDDTTQNPVPARRINTRQWSQSLSIVDGNLCALGDEELRIYGIEDPIAPHFLGSWNLPGNRKCELLACGGNALLLQFTDITSTGDLTYSAELISIQQPRRPVLLAHDSGRVRAAAIDSTFLYVARTTEASVQVFELYGTPPMRVVTELPSSNAMVVHNGLAYLGTRDSSLLVFDVHDPSMPAEIGQLSLDQPPGDMLLSAGYLFIRFYKTREILAVDVQNPRQPAVVSRFDIPSLVQSIRVADGRIFLVLDRGGLLIYVLEPQGTAR